MTRKENLLKEVYNLQNQINEINGTEQKDVEAYASTWQFVRELKQWKINELEQRINNLDKEYQTAVGKKAQEMLRDAYFATPEGAAHKVRLETAIEAKIKEWEQTEQRSIMEIERCIQQLLGMHWGIIDCKQGYLNIGVIDAAKSTAEQREFFFGQHIEIYYNENCYLSGRERFESNCCTAGSYSMTGGTTVGERAMFYVGIGKLYGDAETVECLRIKMRDMAREIDRLGKELDELRAELKNPIKKQEE
jgi:hypothetical protein|nr:MAG TPA: hypothetical protein [Caudoviricetes sp.]